MPCFVAPITSQEGATAVPPGTASAIQTPAIKTGFSDLSHILKCAAAAFLSPPFISVRPSSFIIQDVFSALVSPRARRSPQTQRPGRSLNIDLQAGIEGTPVATETSRKHHFFAIRRQISFSIHGTRVGLSRYRATVSLL